MKSLRRALIIFFPLSFLLFGLFSGAIAEEINVNSQIIEKFKRAKIGEKVDKLIWRGGLVLSSDSPDFGGISGISFTGPNKKITMVSDIGNYITGQLIYDESDKLLALVGVEISPIRNSKGNILPRRFAKDAEAIDTIFRFGQAAAVRIGFENLTRVADFELNNAKPYGAAKKVRIPKELAQERTNASLEALCIAPPNSPIAGSTLLITEDMRVNDDIAAFMLGNLDRGKFSVKKTNSMNPTDCAFLQNGDLLILERGVGFLSFTMQLRKIAADEVKPGARLEGEVILSASGSDIDNMEGITTHIAADGKERIIIVSDDNFNDWERTLLLEFSLR